ncbi:aminotransferase class V-fold PLP-dependent enzyme [Flavobacterium sp. FlaQc-48]|uniref:aminotransferase class V-fold PLP-dependent enzyme n=1 Tax=Flavobacterium sp. FlaQc-48 TaxID=3374181 RepID=UPI0037574AB4
MKIISSLKKVIKKDHKTEEESSRLESYFSVFRENTIGINMTFDSPYGKKQIVYADWTASGRLYGPIETKMRYELGPFVANTHTETSITGSVMTHAYHDAREMIKKHVNADANDVLIVEGSGMTGVINKFQRILGLKVSENLRPYTQIPDALRPIVFITHMEHHSNQTSWLETIAEVKIIPCDKQGLVCYKSFEKLLIQHKDTPIKIASVTACSNVTGIQTDYHRIARMIHGYGGLCFVDFACSAPYVQIDMHPGDHDAYLDAIFFSPHKFLGGPGSSGVLIFNKKLYKNIVPDHPGGGTVSYTNPWGNHDYIDDVEVREDGGTPGFLQTIRIAMAVKLKEKMGVANILEREHELMAIVFDKLSNVDNIVILAGQHTDRLGILSFYITDVHFNLIVKLLNDRYGIQTRGGCSCAGTYGHFLLNVDQQRSTAIKNKIQEGSMIDRPGWIRMSIHPTLTDAEINFICDSIIEVSQNCHQWSNDYYYEPSANEYIHKGRQSMTAEITKDFFSL